MHPLERRVARTIRRHSLLRRGDRVALAVSGGPDSVALVHLLRELASGAPWALAGLIHVHHGLRGQEADADEAFCRELAESLSLTVQTPHADVRGRAAVGRKSLEATAREVRYAALADAASVLGATLVATGHTADDQAETVLLRLLRGAGSRGLGGVRPRRDIFIRPLLDVRRRDLRDYLEERSLPFRDDSSNLDLSIPRNRLRHGLLPLIEQDWPGGVRALARFAEVAADDEHFLSGLSHEVSPALSPASGSDQSSRLDARVLRELPPALARRLVRQALETAGGTPTFRGIEAVRQLARADTSEGHLDLRAVAVQRSGPWLAFGRPARPSPRLAFSYSLPVPGSVRIGETGSTIRASIMAGASQPASGSGFETAVLQGGSVVTPLLVRNRRPGDRLHPLGAPGSRKLQDVLVDRKVPRAQRDRVPVVVDATGDIVWVAGVTIAERCRVTAPQADMVILEFEKGNQ